MLRHSFIAAFFILRDNNGVEVMEMYSNQFDPFQPYGMQFQQQMRQVPQMVNQRPRDLIRVTGMEGARAYQMPPNSREALFDDTDDVVIFKITDGAGFPSYKRARLVWEEEPQKTAPNAADFVTRQEFDELKEAIMRAQQPVRKQRKTEPDEAE